MHTITPSDLQQVLCAAARNGLDIAALSLLAAIAQAEQEEKTLSLAELAERAGITTRRAESALSRLVRAGLVTSEQLRRSALTPSRAIRRLTLAGWHLMAGMSPDEGHAKERAYLDDPVPVPAEEEQPLPAELAVREQVLVDAGIQPQDAATIGRGILQKAGKVLCEMAPEDARATMAELVWSALCGATAAKGWDYGRRISGLAVLLRTRRWRTPRSLSASRRRQLAHAFELRFPSCNDNGALAA